MDNYLFMALFLCIERARELVQYDSQATNRGVPEGGEFSHRVIRFFYWSPGSLVWLLAAQ
jgi:hypothetical protein